MAQEASIQVEPDVVIMESTSERSLVRVTVRDAPGEPAAWAAVSFEAADAAQITFLSQEAITDAAGLAANVIVRLVPPAELSTTYTLTARRTRVGPFQVSGRAVITDGSPFAFVGRPLPDFLGPRQRLTGRVGFFAEPLPLGTRVRAWAIDPRIAEPGVGVITATRAPFQDLEFCVLARSAGRTSFIVQTVDVSIYEADVRGDLSPGPFLGGDCNGDAGLGIADPIFLLTYLFHDGKEPREGEACDSNGDGALDISDAIHVLSYLFLGGPAPPAPFPDCF